MKTIWILVAAVVSISQSSLAASACAGNSLANYVALGGTGCTIGNNTLSDFATLVGTTGATPISPAAISLSPLGSNTDPGLAITVTDSATAGTILEALFTYRISGNLYVSSAITLAQSSETGDGAVTGIQNFCANGAFGPDGVSGCTGTPGSLVTLDGIQNADQTSIAAASFLNVTDDLTIDGGLAGSASAGILTNRFSAVPEPASLLLTVAGFIVALSIRRRLRNRICS